MTNSKLKGIVLSDVHLFHDKAKTFYIVDGLIKAFPIHERFRDVDIFFISGDLFDRTISLSSPDLYYATRFIRHLLKLCSKYDIMLRILEGTPSHDWKQSRVVVEMNESLTNKVDVKHVTNLSIEYIERFDINVLYVPDEWGSGCESTLEEVKELMYSRGLDKVDFSIMHGCFGYQFPVNLAGKPDTHDEVSYLEITKHLVFIGHYHTPSIFERIYVPGSFDRLKHNEEEDKGYLEFTIYDDDTRDVKFIKNPNATIFKTINCRGRKVDEIYRMLDKVTKNVPDDKFSYIKLIANKEDAIYKGMGELKARYRNIFFTVDSKQKKKTEKLATTDDIVKPKTLDSITIEKLMSQRIHDKYPEMANELMTTFKDVINAERTDKPD